MGWSCRADASRAMDLLELACRQFEGSSNVFHVGYSRFSWEIDCKEHEDGRITGEWFALIGDRHCEPRGQFTIVPDGSELIGGHKWMRDAVSGS